MKTIDLTAARTLIDFSGGDSVSATMWEEQLRGAVAIHNILARERVAYLADEVGMGKTYVALGAIALMRHFKPDLRVLYIAPKENIQEKWRKEMCNFTRRNWLGRDDAVRGSDESLPYGLALCQNLENFAAEVATKRERDFVLRMSSFSMAFSKDAATFAVEASRKREKLRQHLPDVPPSAFAMREQMEFKKSYARAIRTILPIFDLLVIDEAHHLKHGRDESATRNVMLEQMLGVPGTVGESAGDSRCFRRALLLSATPWEHDYRQLWNQLDLLGFGQRWKDLDPAHGQSDDTQREAVREFMIRRITSLQINGRRHTKNMYRREWRQGGVQTHDEPLKLAGPREQLILALAQKKVAEVLGDEKFNHQFQIGMLASFESFAQTAKVAHRPDDGEVFDGAGQTRKQLERAGIDVPAITRLAQSYYKVFGESLPHPKMDALAESLADSFVTGEKALIFVRRIASVKELAEKLDRAYDQWLLGYLRSRLRLNLRPEFDEIVLRYDDGRRTRGPADPDLAKSVGGAALDKGSHANFFAWFSAAEHRKSSSPARGSIRDSIPAKVRGWQPCSRTITSLN